VRPLAGRAEQNADEQQQTGGKAPSASVSFVILHIMHPRISFAP